MWIMSTTTEPKWITVINWHHFFHGVNYMLGKSQRNNGHEKWNVTKKVAGWLDFEVMSDYHHVSSGLRCAESNILRKQRFCSVAPAAVAPLSLCLRCAGYQFVHRVAAAGVWCGEMGVNPQWSLRSSLISCGNSEPLLSCPLWMWAAVCVCVARKLRFSHVCVCVFLICLTEMGIKNTMTPASAFSIHRDWELSRKTKSKMNINDFIVDINYWSTIHRPMLNMLLICFLLKFFVIYFSIIKSQSQVCLRVFVSSLWADSLSSLRVDSTTCAPTGIFHQLPPNCSTLRDLNLIFTSSLQLRHVY